MALDSQKRMLALASAVGIVGSREKSLALALKRLAVMAGRSLKVKG
jgi:hypothetical protein